MNQRIFKYRLAVCKQQSFALPQGCEILCVQMQRDDPCVWVLVNTDVTTSVVHTFWTFGTDYPVRPDTFYIGTYQFDIYVWHVFYDFFDPFKIGPGEPNDEKRDARFTLNRASPL